MREKFAPDYPFYDIPGPIAVVHRGGNAAGTEKENSLAAFDSAYAAGFIYAETDTIATIDGIPLAFHCSSNERARKKTGLPLRSMLQAMTYDEIKERIRIGGEIIPTLEEVLTTFPEMRFFIDPKTKEVVGPLADVVQKLNAHDRVSIGAFGYNRTKDTAELLGGQKDVCTSLAILGTTAMVGLSIMRSVSRSHLARVEATSLQVPHSLVTAKRIERAHDLGIHVIVWPQNPSKNDNRSYMDTSLGMGVHGLMSDHTEELKSAVLAHDPTNASIRTTNES